MKKLYTHTHEIVYKHNLSYKSKSNPVFHDVINNMIDWETYSKIVNIQLITAGMKSSNDHVVNTVSYIINRTLILGILTRIRL